MSTLANVLAEIFAPTPQGAYSAYAGNAGDAPPAAASPVPQAPLAMREADLDEAGRAAYSRYMKQQGVGAHEGSLRDFLKSIGQDPGAAAPAPTASPGTRAPTLPASPPPAGQWPTSEPVGVPVDSDAVPTTAPPGAPQYPALIQKLRDLFQGSSPQPTDGAAPPAQAPKQEHWTQRNKRLGEAAAAQPPVSAGDTPDTNAGYARRFGFIAGENDPAVQAPPALPAARPAPAPAGAQSLPGPRAPTPPAASPDTAAPIVAPAPVLQDPPASGQTSGPARGPRAPMLRDPMQPTAGPKQAEPELARTFRAFFQGAAGVNPFSPKFSAFAQGAAGAMKSRYDERQREESLDRQREKDSFDRALKVVKSGRDDALADSKISYYKNRAGVDGDKVRFQDIRGYNDVKNNVNRDFARKIDLINKDYSLSDADKRKAKEDAKTERDTRLAEIEQQYRQRSLTPDMTKPQQPGQQPGQQPRSGDGKSAQSPLTPRSQADIDNAPAGTFFVNPQTGQVFQK